MFIQVFNIYLATNNTAMKKIKKLPALLLLFSILAYVSCSSDEGAPVDGLPLDTAGFTANMNTEGYNATQISALQDNGSITITGARGTNGEKVSIVIQGNSTGVYTNSFMYYMPGIVGIEYINVDPATAHQNGTVHITSLENGRISGTFSFTAYLTDAEPVTFTNGSFQNIPVTHNDPGPVADGTVSATVNGSAVTFINSFYVQADQNYIITGQNAGSSQILQISLPANTGVGTYTIGGEADTIYANISGGDDGNTIVSLTGTLTITGNSDGALTGTFAFTGTDAGGNPVEVIGGEFEVEVQE